MMMRRAIAGLVALIAASGAAAAQDGTLVCVYDTECLQGEACAGSAYELKLHLESEALVIETIAGDLAAAEIGALDDGEAERPRYFVAEDGFALHTVSVLPDGGSFYSVLLTDVPMSITYQGLCEGLE
ncbi:MAG: hypothetical protein KJN93_07650 [Alphaproteobacteria bacterium]|nr:hypothetical protein [Alphaproteobacteria bacterium]